MASCPNNQQCRDEDLTNNTAVNKTSDHPNRYNVVKDDEISLENCYDSQCFPEFTNVKGVPTMLYSKQCYFHGKSKRDKIGPEP